LQYYDKDFAKQTFQLIFMRILLLVSKHGVSGDAGENTIFIDTTQSVDNKK